MTPEEALEFIDTVADGGLGAPDYAEAYGIVKATLARATELQKAATVPPSVTIHAMGHDSTELYGISPEDWMKCGVHVRAQDDRIWKLERGIATHQKERLPHMANADDRALWSLIENR